MEGTDGPKNNTMRELFEDLNGGMEWNGMDGMEWMEWNGMGFLL